LCRVARHEKYVSESGISVNILAARSSKGRPPKARVETGQVSKNGGMTCVISGKLDASPKSLIMTPQRYAQTSGDSGTAITLLPTLRALSIRVFWACDRIELVID
jgi:hypothetical protein